MLDPRVALGVVITVATIRGRCSSEELMAGYSNRDWVCLRKWRYDRSDAAKLEAERLNASPRHVGEFHAYKCPYSSVEKHWHVGRMPGRRYA